MIARGLAIAATLGATFTIFVPAFGAVLGRFL